MMKKGLVPEEELENCFLYCLLLGHEMDCPAQTERPISLVPGNRKLKTL